MTGNPKTIESKAEKLLKSFDCWYYPIDVERLAEELKIKIIYDSMDGEVSGFLFHENGNSIVGINSEHSCRRQRFTIAHEIGHFNLHLQSNNETFIDKNSSSAMYARDRDSGLGLHKKEIEANSFAAALLMPKDLIEECLKEKYSHFNSIEDISWRLAKDFNVSEQAMTIRLVKLKIFDVQ